MTMRRHGVCAVRAVNTVLTHPRTSSPSLCTLCRRAAATATATHPPQLRSAQYTTTTGRKTITRTPLPIVTATAPSPQPPSPITTVTRTSIRSFSTRPRHLRDPSASASASPPASHYDLFPSTFPSGPPPASPFTPDPRALHREFLHLQAAAHPDRAPADRKRHAEALSARINDAYRTLLDPLRRAQHLLARRGVDVEDESAKLDGGDGGGDGGGADATLLMQVMEAREAVDDAADERELAACREENEARVAASVRVLEEAFARDDLVLAAGEAVRLRYWTNIDESIRGWEAGSGGGAVHH